MYDVIIIGTATRDGFFEGIDFFFKNQRPAFSGWRRNLFAFRFKIEVPKSYFYHRRRGHQRGNDFSRQGLKTAVI